MLLTLSASFSSKVSAGEAPSTAKGTILLIHGSAPFNEDGRVPLDHDSVYVRTHFYRDLAQHLGACGWDTVRYAKPGVGANHVDFDLYKKTDLARLTEQIQDLWRTMPKDRPRVVFAWSEGTLHAPLLPLMEATAVILLGAVSTNIKDVIVAQASTAAEREEIDKFLAELPSMDREAMLGVDRPVGRLVDELRLQDNWRNFVEHPELPLLVLHGDADREVSPSQSRVWQQELPGHAITVVTKPGGNHTFGTDDLLGATELANVVCRWLEHVIAR